MAWLVKQMLGNNAITNLLLGRRDGKGYLLGPFVVVVTAFMVAIVVVVVVFALVVFGKLGCLRWQRWSPF
jgi:hypothetical protein